jgi:hypothetical protein
VHMYYVQSMQARRNSGKGNNTNIMQFHTLQNINPFLFIKNKRLFISSEGFSTFEKTP